jgi:hypothetical protein
MDRDQFEVRPWKDTYFRRDRFDRDAKLALVEEVFRTGQTEGYSLTRLLANMEWASRLCGIVSALQS